MARREYRYWEHHLMGAEGASGGQVVPLGAGLACLEVQFQHRGAASAGDGEDANVRETRFVHPHIRVRDIRIRPRDPIQMGAPQLSEPRATKSIYRRHE
jgi:hypothetical protein